MLERVISGFVPNPSQPMTFNGTRFEVVDGILRCLESRSDVDEQLSEFYAKHWNVEDAYDSQSSETYQAEIFTAMFGKQFLGASENVVSGQNILDFGCGTCVAGRVYFGDGLKRANYYAVDMSGSIDRAKLENEQRGLEAAYVQAPLDKLPFDRNVFDIIFCPGVLHYTTSVAESLGILRGYLKPGGQLITWFYKQQAPVRQMTDDYLRSYFTKMAPEEAFEAIKPLTKLGIALGELKAEIEVPDDIDVLGIPKGKYDVQRLFYYYFMKLFHNEDLTFTRHVVNNWNAYYPASVLFTTEQEAKVGLKEASFDVEYFNAEGNGMAIVAKAI